MKILHIVGDSAFGGGARIIAALARRAVDDGHDVRVLTTCAPFQDHLRARGVAVDPLDCVRRDIRPWRDLAGLGRLVAHLRAERPDLVHTHTSKAGFVGRLAARLAGVPRIVHTVHGFAFHGESARRRVVFYVGLERLAARWCDRIVTVSEHHRDWALALGIGRPDRIVAIPNGVPEPSAADPAAAARLRVELSLATDEPVVLCTGRLAPEKGLEDLLAAFARLGAGPRSPARLLLAGDGPLAGDLRARATRLGIAGRVALLGFREDVATLLSLADVVALPSWREGLSIALLEAMAAGRAIVASDLPSNLEATAGGRVARIVGRGDRPRLAAALAGLLAAPAERERLGRAARARWAEAYRQERMLDSYARLYGELAADAAGRG